MHRRKIKIPTDKLDEEQSQEEMYTQGPDKFNKMSGNTLGGKELT